MRLFHFAKGSPPAALPGFVTLPIPVRSSPGPSTRSMGRLLSLLTPFQTLYLPCRGKRPVCRHSARSARLSRHAQNPAASDGHVDTLELKGLFPNSSETVSS